MLSILLILLPPLTELECCSSGYHAKNDSHFLAVEIDITRIIGIIVIVLIVVVIVVIRIRIVTVTIIMVLVTGHPVQQPHGEYPRDSDGAATRSCELAIQESVVQCN